MKSIQFITLITMVTTLVLGEAVAQPATTGKEILANAIKATGGKFGGLRGPLLWMTHGVQHESGSPEPFVAQYASRWPDWFRWELEGKYTVTVNQSQAWITMPQGVTLLSGEDLTETLQLVRLIWAGRLFPLQDETQYQLEAIPGVRVDSATTIGLGVKHTDGHEFQLYFDPDSYLLSKLSARTGVYGGAANDTMEFYFSAHRSFAGARMPAKVRVVYGGKLVTEAEVVVSKAGATLDPDFFKVPR